RLGGEYLVTPETAIRLGYYYDPAPAPDETLNILFPSSTNHVATIGFGHSFRKYRVDVAAEYLLGGDRDVEAYPNPLQPDNMPGVHHLDVFAFSVGFGMCL
ncbi:MAG: outer membrane protein transport protein, partial [Ignavibacteriae bacterium]|nr:outer membrane protein transport protein [Ignavibacteriota bacterium]